VEAGIIGPTDTYLDYGCGRGHDVQHLQKRGVQAFGWDPHWRPEPQPVEADIVACVFVLNVVEVIDERAEILHKAWELARKSLVVAARVDKPSYTGVPYGDGVVTKRNTFQHFYTHTSLRAYIEQVLGVSPKSMGAGVYLLEKPDSVVED
jgi:DNA phosphorothioation-associated putative methyltransferase